MKTKLKLLNFSGSDCREYKTPKGNTYTFYKGITRIIEDPDDALHFINAAGGKAFEVEGTIAKVKDALKKASKKLLKDDEADEENPPEETGALEPTPEDLAIADGETTPIDGEPGDDHEDAEGESEKLDTGEEETQGAKDLKGVPNDITDEEAKAADEAYKADPERMLKDAAPEGTEDEEPVNPDGSPGKNIYTHEGLKALNAKQQTYLIKQVQGETASIPRLENEKIALLLKLQEEGADLLETIKGYQA